jgi:hypothetical protein
MQEYSMDDPPIVTWPYLQPGDNFIFKGNYCTVTRLHKKTFEYVIQGNEKVRCFMYYSFYLTTPSYFGRFHKKI